MSTVEDKNIDLDQWTGWTPHHWLYWLLPLTLYSLCRSVRVSQWTGSLKKRSPGFPDHPRSPLRSHRGLTLQKADHIDSFEARRSSTFPWLDWALVSATPRMPCIPRYPLGAKDGPRYSRLKAEVRISTAKALLLCLLKIFVPSWLRRNVAKCPLRDLNDLNGTYGSKLSTALQIWIVLMTRICSSGPLIPTHTHIFPQNLPVISCPTSAVLQLLHTSGEGLPGSCLSWEPAEKTTWHSVSSSFRQVKNNVRNNTK